jgi:DNA-binding NarL/FixJ family response regulator
MSTGGIPQGRFISVLVGENTRIHSQLLAEAISHDRGLRVIGAVSTAAEFLSIAARRKPDVAVVSAGLGEDPICGLATLRQFHAEHPEVPAIVLLDSSRREVVLEAFRCGARGIFSKNESLEQLRKCVRSVHQGQVWANSREVRFALEALSAAPSIRAVNANGFEILSARELEVVQHLAEGMTNRGIGERMGLSPHTIKNYVLRIFDKLGVSNRVELLKLTLAHPSMPRRSAQRPQEEAQGASAISWCQNAAEHGMPYAQLLLAELYRSGKEVPQDAVAAYYWYSLCEKTHPEIFAPARGEKDQVAALLTAAQIDSVHARIANPQTSVAVKALKPGRDSAAAPAVPSRRVAFGD